MALLQYLQHGIDEKDLPQTAAGLTITAVLGWLPGSRLVVDGYWNGQPVVAKLFCPGSKGKRAQRKEVRGLQAIAKCNVHCPAIKDVLTLDEGIHLLVMEKLEGETALRYCLQGSRAQRRSRIHRLACWVREVQQKGVVQTDIHPGNFFFTAGGWALLDAAECRFGSPTPVRAKANLAALLAQFPPLDLPDVRDCFAELGEYQGALRVARRRRYQMILKKALRPCTEFAAFRQGDVRGMCRRELLPQVEALLARGLDDVMQTTDSLKLGGASTVVRDGQSGWVIKRYNIKSFVHRIKRQWGATRAQKAWLGGVFLREVGVQTPLPVAYLEERRHGLRHRAWIINAYQSGRGLDELSPEQAPPEPVVLSLQDYFLLMAQLGFQHGDMKSTNILVCNDRISVIDLDAFNPFPRDPEASYRKDYNRFMRNWPKGSVLRTSLERAIAEAGLSDHNQGV